MLNRPGSRPRQVSGTRAPAEVVDRTGQLDETRRRPPWLGQHQTPTDGGKGGVRTQQGANAVESKKVTPAGFTVTSPWKPSIARSSWAVTPALNSSPTTPSVTPERQVRADHDGGLISDVGHVTVQ